jgi:hypothetical protein
LFQLKLYIKSGIWNTPYNPSIREAEAGESKVPGQPGYIVGILGLCSRIQLAAYSTH